MKKVMVFAGVVLVWALTAAGSSAAKASDLLVNDICSFNRSFFPPGFIFGTAGSSYQYEGAANESGRAPSIWDTFTHDYPEKIADGSNGDVAVDQYHRYKEDIEIMEYMNLDAYRFSISWSRLLPRGRVSGGINQEGVDYYNNFINELLSKGLTPFATIFHWDVPQALEDEYGGFLSSNIRKDFGEYAEVCFKLFGDRVKHWITLNEPHIFTDNGYAVGTMAPGRCSDWQNLNCTGGDSSTEPYIVAHNLLLSHANAVQIYRSKFQASQQGTIGITMNSHCFVPMTDSQADQDAASRAFDFMFGWFMRPLAYGEYPKSMQRLVGSRLPKFSSEESELVQGSFDFLGLNYYTARYATDAPYSTAEGHTSYLTDPEVAYSTERDGRPIGPRAASAWLYIYPRGIREVLRRVKTEYNDPLIYITENGMDDFNDASLTLDESLLDSYRIDFYFRHLYYIRSAIYDYGVNIKGYFAWSLLDNFEWFNGYTVRFGINFVDYENGLQRHPKLSAQWFKNFLKKEGASLRSSV